MGGKIERKKQKEGLSGGSTKRKNLCEMLVKGTAVGLGGWMGGREGKSIEVE